MNHKIQTFCYWCNREFDSEVTVPGGEVALHDECVEPAQGYASWFQGQLRAAVDAHAGT